MPRAPCPMPSVPIHPFHRAPGCSRTPSRWTLNVPTASPASSGGAVAGCGSSTPPAPNASPATGGNPGTPATTGTARIPKARAPSSSTTTTRQAVPGSCRGGMTDERANGQTGRRVALPDLAPGPMPHALGPMPHASEYVELHCHSVFSLLDGASEPEELVARAVALGMSALALTDHDDLGGAVRFAQAARELDLAGILGAELTVQVGTDPTHLVLLAESREGYGNLSTLITRARMDTTRGDPAVTLDTMARHTRGRSALTGCPSGWVPQRLAAGDADGASDAVATLLDLFDGRLAIECWDHRLPEEQALVRQLIPLARSFNIPWVVTNDVHYAMPRGRLVHDVLAAIRHKKQLDEMGTRLRPNGEWYLRSAEQMRRRWQLDDTGLRNTLGIAERCAFRLEDLKPALPDFPLPPGVTPDAYLHQLVMQGAMERIRPEARVQKPEQPRAPYPVPRTPT